MKTFADRGVPDDAVKVESVYTSVCLYAIQGDVEAMVELHPSDARALAHELLRLADTITEGK